MKSSRRRRMNGCCDVLFFVGVVGVDVGVDVVVDVAVGVVAVGGGVVCGCQTALADSQEL